MKQKTKVLIVTQEMEPYIDLSGIGKIVRRLPQHLQEKGMEIRILMPRFGVINERRHRLHEVVRLSGINIIIDEDDYPLLIKVASLPGARMQVYFLDNEDFFKRKFVYRDKNEKFYTDNTERSIFFCKGVLETVRKFGWSPDIIHCHGWMTSLLPLYVKEAYKNDPIFTNAKVIYSLYNDTFEEQMHEEFVQKAAINGIDKELIAPYGVGKHNELQTGAMHYADALIVGDESKNELATAAEKPMLAFAEGEAADIVPSYKEFYLQLLEEEKEEA